jgi:hypothetical protein
MKISRKANVGSRAISRLIAHKRDGLSIGESVQIAAIIQLAMNGADESEFDKVIPGKVSIAVTPTNNEK